MSFLIDYLQGQIGRCSTKRFIKLVKILCSFAESEVSEKSMALSIKNYVFWLKISIKDIIFMESFNS